MRILFITATRIGDAVMSTGVLHALIERHPDARFTIACGPLAASLFAAVPRLDSVIMVRKRRFDLHWLALWGILRRTKWDLIVDLRRSLIAYTLHARERRVLGPGDPCRHRVADLPAVIGIDGPCDPHIFMASAHHVAAAQLIPEGLPVLAVGPVASLASKTWPRERFVEVIGLLTASGAICAGWRVAGFGAAGDEAAVADALAGLPAAQRIAVVGESDLLTVTAALARCAAFIGNDSGLSHLAAAVRLPTIAVFGTTSAVRYAPWGGVAVTSPDPSNLAALPAVTVVRSLSRLLEQRQPAGYAEPHLVGDPQ